MTSETKFENPFDKLAAEGTSKMEHFMEEYKRLEEQQQQRAVELIDEGAKMVKASVDYGIKLTDEMRRMTIETNRQVLEMFSTRWY